MEFFQVMYRAPVVEDFRDLLAHGWYDDQEEIEAPCLVRPGPFIPKITMPSGFDFVVTDEMRRKTLESPHFRDLSFREVYKLHIPELHWELWGAAWDIPEAEFPNQEIEPWLLTLPHSPSASDELGTLWEIQLPFGASAKPRDNVKPWKYNIVIDASTWTGSHFCLVGNPSESLKHQRWPVVSPVGKQWIEQHAGDWFWFKPSFVND